MGYVVLHFNKAKGNEARMTKHIERKVDPPNVDKGRTHLNRELIDFPDGVTNRTQAIQHRIKTADIFRKITADQVRVIRVNVSGSHGDMMRIQSEGRLDEWCRDNLDYFKREFGEKNIVSAVLHLDEKTPHIHIALVPVVTGLRRKAKEGAKEKETVRLCADDVLTKSKMKGYQDSYAVAMGKYGLQRGIEGSKARHKTTAQYYRDTFEQTLNLKDEVGELQRQKQQEQLILMELQEKEVKEQERLAALEAETDRKQKEVDEKQREVQKAKNEIALLGVESSLKKTAKNVSEGIGALMGNPKAKKLEAQNEKLKQEIETLQEEKEVISKQAKRDSAEKDRSILERDSVINIHKGKLDRLFDYFPILGEYDFIMRLCDVIQLPANFINKLFSDKEVSFTGKLHSPEHKHFFDADNVKIAIAKNAKDNKPFLAIEGKEYGVWFREQKQKFYERLGIKVNEPRNQQGQRW